MFLKWFVSAVPVTSYLKKKRTIVLFRKNKTHVSNNNNKSKVKTPVLRKKNLKSRKVIWTGRYITISSDLLSSKLEHSTKLVYLHVYLSSRLIPNLNWRFAHEWAGILIGR